MEPTKKIKELSLAQKFYMVFKEFGYKSNADFAKDIHATKATVGQWFNYNMKPGEKYIYYLLKAHPEVNVNFFTKDELPVILEDFNQSDKCLQLKRICETKEREIVHLRDQLNSLQKTIRILNESSTIKDPT